MRHRYIWDPNRRALVEVALNHRSAPAAPTVWKDLPPYASPIDGRMVDGRRQRREDLKRSDCRPYEGREQEAKEAAKIQQASERALDQLAEKIAHRAWAEAPERVRKVFRGK